MEVSDAGKTIESVSLRALLLVGEFVPGGRERRVNHHKHRHEHVPAFRLMCDN